MVRVLAVADETVESFWRSKARDVAPDLVVAAGDLPWDYVEFIASSVDVPVVFVPGNHDPEVATSRVSRSGLHTVAGLPCDAPRPHGVTHLDGHVADLAGLRIAGLGGCVRYRPGPHQYSQREYRGRLRRLARRVRRHDRRSPGGLDLLVTHAPPLGLGDGDDGPHVGIEALVPFLLEVQPTWHLHGHIHPYGRTMPDRTLGRTTLRNVIPYRVLEIEPLTAGLPVRVG
ncbi:metallophosphoesterase family protein [Solicola sp. PLA-1-18]|uniref:metallophosphoesterase family protein n=1 Tax=Solicola sp. PLA-1-18 TaxID=3380532 RepID=UPI003B7E993C